MNLYNVTILKVLLLIINVIPIIESSIDFINKNDGYDKAERLSPMVNKKNNHLKSISFKNSPTGCIMRGICGGVNQTLKQNCAYQTPAVPSDAHLSNELVDLCPTLFNDGMYCYSGLRIMGLNEYIRSSFMKRTFKLR